jgi:hypothetical protein
MGCQQFMSRFVFVLKLFIYRDLLKFQIFPAIFVGKPAPQFEKVQVCIPMLAQLLNHPDK